MVVKIDPPEDDSIRTFEKIIDERVLYKTFYNSVRDDWLNKIELYIDNKGDPSKLTALDLSQYTDNEAESKARKKSLINLYSPKEDKIPFDILSKMRRDHGLLICPSCGAAGPPGTLDHYIPKSKFPELSILLLNLTPMCTDCQQKKRTEYLTESGSKKYLHPYYDDINTHLYSVKFSPPYITPTFTIEANATLENELLNLVEEHMKGIDLKLRFKRFCKSKYIHLLKMAVRNRASKGLVGLKVTIKITLSSEEDKAVNCWEAIFYRSVLEDELLMEYLEKGDLPENL